MHHLFLYIILFLPGMNENTPPKKWALLVGINKYQHLKGFQLNGAINDIENIKDVLVSHFDFPSNQIVTLKNAEATRNQIIHQFEKHLIENAKANDIVVFHFSGHGSKQKDLSEEELDKKDETLVPYDSRDPEEKVFDILDDELHQLLQRLSLRCKNITVILDSCYSGTGTRGQGTRFLEPDTRPRPNRKQKKSNNNGEPNYTLISAASSKQIAKEIKIRGQSHGVLSYALGQVLRNLQAGESYMDVMREVIWMVDISGYQQVPQISGSQRFQEVFGGKPAISHQNIYATPDLQQRNEVTLNAGLMDGMTVGSIFESEKQSRRLFEVSEVKNFESYGKQRFGPPLNKPIAVREIQHQYPKQQLRLALSSTNPVLSQHLKHMLKRFPVIETVSLDQDWHLHLSLAQETHELKIRGETTPHRLMGYHEETLLMELKKWVHWFSVLDIKNPSSPLKIRLSLGKGDRRSGKGFAQIGPVQVHLKTNDVLVCRVHNLSETALYLNIVNLATSNGSITRIHPRNESQEALAPQTYHDFKFRVFWPEGSHSSRDIIKVFASTTPVILSGDQMPQKPKTSLEQIWRSKTSGEMTSNNVQGTAPQSWVTTEAVIRVTRAP